MVVLQDSYSRSTNGDDRERARWMALLSRAPAELLEAWAAGLRSTEFEWLRQPEQGLVMVQARAGGTGERFNFGEMTVTRCVLRLRSGRTGVAYVQGRSRRRAELAALADAMLQDPELAESVMNGLIGPVAAQRSSESERSARKAQATKVEFFTLAHEED
jgi:alpha-D-ribose 1-methylphosphonate 5-triphosphate synthase subunit PhnG